MVRAMNVISGSGKQIASDVAALTRNQEHMATKADLERALEHMATKADLERALKRIYVFVGSAAAGSVGLIIGAMSLLLS